MDTRDYVRNKFASVAVGRCVVTGLPLAFAALCAQDAAHVMRYLVAMRPRRHAATLLRHATQQRSRTGSA